MEETGGFPITILSALYQNLVPPQNFPKNSRENNILLFLNKILWLKIQPSPHYLNFEGKPCIDQNFNVLLLFFTFSCYLTSEYSSE